MRFVHPTSPAFGFVCLDRLPRGRTLCRGHGAEREGPSTQVHVRVCVSCVIPLSPEGRDGSEEAGGQRRGHCIPAGESGRGRLVRCGGRSDDAASGVRVCDWPGGEAGGEGGHCWMRRTRESRGRKKERGVGHRGRLALHKKN